MNTSSTHSTVNTVIKSPTHQHSNINNTSKYQPRHLKINTFNAHQHIYIIINSSIFSTHQRVNTSTPQNLHFQHINASTYHHTCRNFTQSSGLELQFWVLHSREFYLMQKNYSTVHINLLTQLSTFTATHRYMTIESSNQDITVLLLGLSSHPALSVKFSFRWRRGWVFPPLKSKTCWYLFWELMQRNSEFELFLIFRFPNFLCLSNHVHDLSRRVSNLSKKTSVSFDQSLMKWFCLKVHFISVLCWLCFWLC
jgi:hypothetical protein